MENGTILTSEGNDLFYDLCAISQAQNFEEDLHCRNFCKDGDSPVPDGMLEKGNFI